MCVRYKGATSSFHRVPGGGPQGGLLTSVLFILQVNKAGSPCELPHPGENTFLLPAVHSEPDEVPVRGRSVILAPSNLHEPDQDPVNGQDAFDMPSNLHEPAQGPVGRQDVIEIPFYLHEPDKDPVSGQDTIVNPSSLHEAAQDQVIGMDAFVSTSNLDEPVQEPISWQDIIITPHETAQDPVSGQEAIVSPSNLHEPAQDSVHGQDASVNPSSMQGPAQDPIRGQNLITVPICHRKKLTHKNSFIDDLTLLEKISLKDLIEKDRIIGPLDFHDRFNLTMPENRSLLQHRLEDLREYTLNHHMILNSKKTKVFPFINSHTKDFMPQLRIENNPAVPAGWKFGQPRPSSRLESQDEDVNFIEVIHQLKLVGMVITSDLTWHAHVQYTVGRINKIIWQLTRFKQYGASQEKLKIFYILKIRSILMFRSVSFHSSLSSDLSQILELQQKRSFAIILGQQYRNYDHARILLDLPRLDKLRQEACIKWAVRAQKNPQHCHLFPLTRNNVNTRSKKKFVEYFCHTTKYFKSAVPYMTRALNKREADQPDQVSITTNSGIVICV